jgi:thioester reductase-like protein
VTTIIRPSASLEDRVARIVADVLRVPPALVSSGISFPELGMDSLAAVELTTAIEDAIQVELPMSAVHEHPTLTALCAFVRSGAGADPANATRALMRADAKLPPDIRLDAGGGSGRLTRDARRILVTGATGFVGAFLVRALADETSADIVCLVRASGEDPRTRLRAKLESLGLWCHALEQRVHIVVGDLSHPRLGLGRGDFTLVAESVDAIYHAAADVNWVSGYDALRATNVVGTVELIRLAFTGAPKPFHFVSSVSVCHSTAAPRNVDESLDALQSIDGLWLGYAQSKCVAEALAREAGTRGLPVTIHRPSLVSGDALTGHSNPEDLVSRFIAGCVAMRAAPDLDWRVDCVPVSDVAKSVARLSCAHESGVSISHITATSPKHWRECVLWMRLSGYDIELVPYREWVAMLAEAGERNPLNVMRAFFSRTISAEQSLTLPELFEESRRSRVSNERTRVELASLGVESTPLTTPVLSRYFDDFERVGLVPRSATRSRSTQPATAPSLDGVRRQLEQSLSVALGDAVRLDSMDLRPIDTDESIVAELTAWRGGTPSGLFHADITVTDARALRRSKRVFVKSKPVDREIIDVAESVAALASPALGETISRFREHLGFTKAHEREVALYADSDVRLRRHTPAVYATLADDDARQWLVVLESLAETGFEAVNVHHASSSEQLDAVVSGLASIHAVGIERRTELESASWHAPLRTDEQRRVMLPLWSALASHALSRSEPWNDRRLRQAHERAIANLSTWSLALESGPKTLIHNDFNPRNFVLRRSPDGVTLCAYDWELATMGLPQRDLAECLAFMLPERASREQISRQLEQHRGALERETGIEIRRDEWDHGFRASLCDFLVDRLASYAMVDRVRRQAFLPRVARGWLNLYQHYPLT